MSKTMKVFLLILAGFAIVIFGPIVFLINELVMVADSTPEHALPRDFVIMADEFANMPPLKDVTTMVTAARSRNIRFTFIIQNFAQLYEVYGKENGENKCNASS